MRDPPANLALVRGRVRAQLLPSDGRRRRNAKHTAARQRFAIAARSLLARWRVTQYETRVKSVVWFMSGGGARGCHRCAIAPCMHAAACEELEEELEGPAVALELARAHTPTLLLVASTPSARALRSPTS